MKVCSVCGKEFVVKPSHVARRIYCSRLCHGAAQAVEWQGANNPSWTGGYEPYYGPSWRSAQRQVRARDTVCQGCGMSPAEQGRALDVHHIVPFKSFGLARHAEANHPDNLVALCVSCHLKADWSENRRAKPA